MSKRKADVTVRSPAELVQSTAPARDLWPGIAQQLAPRRRAWQLPAAIAASLVLVTVGVAIGIHIARPVGSQVAALDAGALIRATFEADPGYQQRRDELLQALPSKLQSLPEEARQRVRDSLTAVQQAQRDLEAELGRQSGNALLSELLIDVYEEELRVLTVVSEAGDPNLEI